MTRNEFIAMAAMKYFKDLPDNSINAEMAADKADSLACELEEAKAAPWQEKSPNEALLEGLAGTFRKAAESLGAPAAPPAVSADFPVAVVDVKAPAPLSSILGDLAKQFPPAAGIPAGTWELVFRPAKTAAPGGLIIPGGNG